MADVKITDLNAVTSISDSDILHVSVSNVDKKITKVNALQDQALDNAVVHDTGNETVAGIKTFTSFPVTPSSAPTTDYQVANKKYVDDSIVGTSVGTKSDDYTITDADGYDILILSGAAANKTFTLPTAADNTDRILTFINMDTTYELNIDGEGAETIRWEDTEVTDIDIEIQGSGFQVFCDGTRWIVLKVFGAKMWVYSSAVEMVYTKTFTGTLDADATTDIAHGISNAITTIIHIGYNLANVGSGLVIVDYNRSTDATNEFQIYWDATNITFTNVGTNYQGDPYDLVVDYII